MRNETTSKSQPIIYINHWYGSSIPMATAYLQCVASQHHPLWVYSLVQSQTPFLTAVSRQYVRHAGLLGYWLHCPVYEIDWVLVLADVTLIYRLLQMPTNQMHFCFHVNRSFLPTEQKGLTPNLQTNLSNLNLYTSNRNAMNNKLLQFKCSNFRITGLNIERIESPFTWLIEAMHIF